MNFQKQFDRLANLAQEKGYDLQKELDLLEKKMDLGETPAWDKVLLARHPERPGTLDYIRLICDEYIELHGDRFFGDDPALVGGIGTIGSLSFTFLGHQKGHNMKENILRNYGMAGPEGYRKALRLAKQAEKFGRPILTFIDTPGAYPGLGAEERGIGEAIAVNLKVFSVLKVPVLSVIIGEGGSGGALGIGVGDSLFMLENSVYSVISPEGFASILLRAPQKAPEAAQKMKMTARDLYDFQIINGIIPEPRGGAHTNPEEAAKNIKEHILTELKRLKEKKIDQLVRYRLRNFREMGVFQSET